MQARRPRRFKDLAEANVLGVRVPVASTPFARLLGLALLDRELAGKGLLIPRCRAVHSFGMRFDLDLVFLDGDGRVIEPRRSLPPRRVVGCRSAAAVLELPSP